MNSRGCANSEIKTPQMYNGAYTDDLRLALTHIQKKLGVQTPLVAIGFSLGSNVLVKVHTLVKDFLLYIDYLVVSWRRRRQNPI